MGKKLHVNTDELRMAAERLDMHAADLGHGHAVAHANIASAVPGFGASLSAAALAERVAQWELETAEHQAELARHARVIVLQSLGTRPLIRTAARTLPPSGATRVLRAK
ncbi:hypothetical protein [Mycobacterium sp. NPDC006124]|uniref:hypothetical protein n=1 Tax=Mycobacterium sp. NPDC006124 TaxID=3156729 RepID=UPI0033A5ABCB